MADCVISFLLQKMGEILQQEQTLLGGVRGDLEFIRDELQHMRAFLRVTEEMAESDPQLGTWVNQIRCIAFDIEDVLDEFSLRILLPTRQMSGIFYGSISKVLSFVWNMKYLRGVACKILAIKSRTIVASESYSRYRIPDQVSVSASGTKNNLWHERRADAVLLEEGELVGIGTPKKELIKWLTESDHLAFKTVSVVGMGGLGKTTLVKQVYDDARVRKHFHGRVWITVSSSFELEKLLKELIVKLHEQNQQAVPVGMERMSNSELKVIVRNCLQKDNFLIVLDDMWEVAAWEAIEYALPQSGCGSRVMLTTRTVEVASTSCAASKGRVYHLKALPCEESWTLFCNKTFQAKECPSHLKEICYGILKRCEGLPLAIVAIGGLLATKDTSKIDEWDMVKQNLGGELMGNKLESLKKILLLSYFDLPYYLKSCMLYLCMFPEDYEVEWMRLVRLLIAEGFVEAKEEMTPEEVVISYLNELLDRSLIEASGVDIDGRIRRCRMHDLLREIILSKSKAQNFVHIGNNGVHQNAIWSEKIRRLSIKNNFGLGNVHTKKHISGLRSLVVFEDDSFSLKSTILKLFGNQVRLLTALDMRGAKLEMFPEEIMKLYHLRYLSLRDTRVGKIPTSIGRLQNLETLDLKRTNVTSLPSTITNLRRLRHLLVYSLTRLSEQHDIVTCGFEAKFGVMGCLQSLQKLCYIQASEGNGIVQELGRLNQLRKLGIVELRKKDGMELCSSIEKLTNLRTLSVGSITGDETLELQNISSPPQFLQRLGLDGRLDRVPHWISSLHNLKGLFLLKSQLMNNVLEPIQDLPNLVHFLLAEAFGGERLCFRAGRFQKLKFLWVRGLHGLKRMDVEDGAMPCLEELDIRSCQLLEKVPNGIQYLSNLQRFQIAQLSDNLISNIVPTKGGQDCWKLKHIPQVVLCIFEDGNWISQRL